jgi:hypothetical protein
MVGYSLGTCIHARRRHVKQGAPDAGTKQRGNLASNTPSASIGILVVDGKAGHGYLREGVPRQLLVQCALV